MHRLVIISAEFAEQSCDLCDGVFTLGRSSRNHIVVLHESVSARHCELLVYDREVIVRECGSRNGTFVQGIRVAAQKGVNHGQVLHFGNVEARIELESAGDDEADSITAMDHYRSFVNSPPGSAVKPTSFPVFFIPTQPVQLLPATVKMPAPPQGREIASARSGDQIPGVRRNRHTAWRTLWFALLAAGATSLGLLLLWWLLK